jgi:putative hydroxymethylpyrimidine transport system substrate-binding protein
METPLIRRLSLLILVITAAICTVVVAGCGGGGEDADDPTPVSLILDWFPNVDHAGIYGALDQGYFADEGLAVEPSVPSDPAASLKQVGIGRADFAISYEQEVLIARSAGVPVVAVAALVTKPLNTVLVRRDRGIATARDLEGKTVGVAGVPSDRPLLESVVRSAGGDPSAVTVRNIGFTLAPALAAGKVDAVIGAYWNVEQIELERQGVDVGALRLEENGVPDYDELVVVASDTTLRERPELVRSFLRGLRAGQDWAATDQAGAIDALLDANQELDRETLAAQLAVTADILSPAEEPTLSIDPRQWAAFARWMRENGLLTEPLDVGSAVTDRFLPPE